MESTPSTADLILTLGS